MDMQDWLHAIRTHIASYDPGRLLHSATTPSNIASTLAPFLGGPLGMAAANGMGQPSDILPPRAPTGPTSPPPAPPPVDMPPVASPPISTPNNVPAPQPTQPMPPVQGLDLPMAPRVPMPQVRPQMAPAPVPMPQARPDAAPQADPMSWFARNAATMRDPSTGSYIDPQAAAKVDATGPEVIQKFMNFFHNKGVS